MNKVILSSLALLGLSVAFVAPAQAQSSVLVNSTNSQGSITGAATVVNMNGLTSAMAAQVTYPSHVYALGGVVTPLYAMQTDGSTLLLTGLTVRPLDQLATTTLPVSLVETAVAAKLGGAHITISDQVSIIRAWRSGLN